MRAAGLSSRAVSDADRRVLEFASVNALMSGFQTVRLLGTDAEDAEHQMSELVLAGFLSFGRRGPRDAGLFRITSAGLAAIGSPLAPPSFDHRVERVLGVGWLWLLACEGVFGASGRVVTERQMRQEDLENRVDAPFAARPDQFGGRPEPHYPDLMFLTRHGRLAVHLLLRPPTPTVLEPVLRAYAADIRMSELLYLAADPRIGQVVQSAAARLELSPMVHVQSATVPLS